MHIFVKSRTGALSVGIEADATVEDLKQKLQERGEASDFLLEQQILKFKGRALKDDEILGKCGIKEDSEINFSVLLRGKDVLLNHVVKVVPKGGATAVPLKSTVKILFDDEILELNNGVRLSIQERIPEFEQEAKLDQSTPENEIGYVTKSEWEPHHPPFNIEIDEKARSVELVPRETLRPGAEYTVRISGALGTTKNNAFTVKDFSFSFRTVEAASVTLYVTEVDADLMTEAKPLTPLSPVSPASPSASSPKVSSPTAKEILPLEFKRTIKFTPCPMPETALINTVAKALLCRRAQVKQIAIVDAKEVEKGKITIESKTEYVLGNSDSIARLADGSHLIVLLGHPPIPRGGTEKIKQLKGMGFSTKRAEQALRYCAWNLDLAINNLIGELH